MTPKEKCDLFYRAYKEHLNLDYMRGKKDHLVIKNYEVTEELLKVYFTSDNILFKNKHSILNFIRHYNPLRAEAAGAYKKSKFPDHYDPEVERKYSNNQAKLQEYWTHLRSKGYAFQNGRWIKATTNH